ncbi:ABC transporter permease [Embleya hyalina]|uniref:ABC transporter permease n=1 Tax=Embleya hyalina TaxID=516124 RepID=A0A401Z5Z6_9ACTN|nr:ABC transporter permease subunit [Embleya hyalina]GCE02274.1 ABC transporter permease [Embleya hyalina]
MTVSVDVRRILVPAVSGLLCLGLWTLLARTVVEADALVSTPLAVVSEVWDEWDSIGPHAGATARAAIVGFLIGNGLAILAGSIAVLVPGLEPVLARLGLAIYCMPMTAVAPILQIVFVGRAPLVVMTALFVFFTTYVATVVGLRRADDAALAVVHVAGGGRLAQLVRVRITSALPGITAGLAVAAPAAVVGTMLGEYMGSSTGLGVAMVQARSALQVERTWALGATAAALTLIGYVGVRLLGRLATPWARDGAHLAVGPAPVTVAGSWRRVAAAAGTVAATVAVALGGWHLFVRALGLDPYFAKTPADVARLFTQGPDVHTHWSDLADAFETTAGHALVGLAAGFAAAILLAVAVALSPALDRLLAPYLIVLAAIPIAAMVPVIALVLGRGQTSVAVVVALLTFLPTFVNASLGLDAAPSQARELIHVNGGSRLHVLALVQLRYSVPWLFAAARIAAPGAIGGALVAEWLITGDVLAALLQRSRNMGDFTAIWAYGVAAVVVSLLVYAVVTALETLALHPEQA